MTTTLRDIKVQASTLLAGNIKLASTGENLQVRIELLMRIDDLEGFVDGSDPHVKLEGTVIIGGLSPAPIDSNRAAAAALAPAPHGARELVASIPFQGDDKPMECRLRGVIGPFSRQERGEASLSLGELELTWVEWQQDGDGKVLGKGVVSIPAEEWPATLRSVEITGGTSRWDRTAARIALLDYVLGSVSRSFLSPWSPIYETSYENIVLSGTLRPRDGSEGERNFFLVSGAHDVGFPWGDGETFWDVLLVVEGEDGDWNRYVAADRWLPGLRENVEKGSYSYRGWIARLEQGQSEVSLLELLEKKQTNDPGELSLELQFDPIPRDEIPFPFPRIPAAIRHASTEIIEQLQTWAPETRPFGIHIRPFTLKNVRGTVQFERDGTEWEVVPDSTLGEAEHSTFRNLREPTLLYGYLCAVNPELERHRVQIHTGVLRDERQRWLKDQLDLLVGELVERNLSVDIVTDRRGMRVDKLVFEPPSFSVRNWWADLLRGIGRASATDRGRDQVMQKLEPALLTLRLDHYPTAQFQRKIVQVRDPDGTSSLALEEAMSNMRLGAVNSHREATVAVSRRQDKLQALDEALDHARFDEVIDELVDASGKPRDQVLVAIKPNFMFSYSKYDRTTFVDPELFRHLVLRLRAKGLRNIKLVEARSTYGVYFDKRTVREMADYLGYSETDPQGNKIYEIVDLTEEADAQTDTTYFGPHLGNHKVPPTWRDADIRISFAKNKTHAYAFYTLTIKNVYGTLPIENKFKAYHCERDIYETTMEWLEHFPVHYGIIDAFLSADGPFGVFADTSPNDTRTVIAGTDIVAVDWVGASKMGLDPMVSKYMKLAVERFGKPTIHLWGDPSIYRPWLNVPVGLTIFTNEGLDFDYKTGNLLYAAAAQMDSQHFTYKYRDPLASMLRPLLESTRKAVFVRTAEKPSLANRALSKLFTFLGR